MALLVDDPAATMPLGINAQHGPAVFQQTSRRMAEVLTRLAIHHDLPIRLIVQVNERGMASGLISSGNPT